MKYHTIYFVENIKPVTFQTRKTDEQNIFAIVRIITIKEIEKADYNGRLKHSFREIK